MSGLQLHGVVKHYRSVGETVRAVDGISLTVSPGELLALYGPSGSGKSTLLQLTAGMLVPDAGSVLFDGRDIARLSPQESAAYRLRDVGLVFQSFHLIAGASALENAAVKLLADGFSLRDARRRARPWLERVGLGARAEHVPAQLSMGERQRVAIARALVNDPSLILADEPTGALDTKTSHDVMRLIARLNAERRITILLVTHEADIAAYAHRLILFRDGKVESDAPTPRQGTAV